MGRFLSRSSQSGKSFVVRQFLCSISKPVSSSRPASLTSSRAGAVKVGRRANLAACSELARPYLDSFEHDGTLGAIGMTIRGEPAFGRDQSRHNLVSGGSKDPNHDAIMRIGSEAPRRRTHSAQRRQSRGFSRDPATSNRHRRPVACVRTGPKLSGVAFNVLRSPCWTQNDALRHHAIADEVPERD